MLKRTTKNYSETLSAKRIVVEYGLREMKDQKPYFTVTGSIEERRGSRWRDDVCGCIHEEIERLFRGEFSDLIALHLCSEDGAPLHTVRNGIYFLAGCVEGNLGERYHLGNGADPKNREECLVALAKHLRRPLAEVEKVRDEIEACREEALTTRGEPEEKVNESTKNRFMAYLNTLYPAWKAEAERAIVRHGLRPSV